MAKLTILDKIKMVLFDSSKFFDKIKSKKGLKDSFVYYAVLAGAYALLYSIVVIFLSPIGGDYVYIIASYFVGLILTFVAVGILHVIAKILGGKGDYSDTFKASVYGSTPAIVLSWIPLVGILGSLWSLYITTVGMSKLHNVSKLRAAIIVLILPLVMIVLAVYWMMNVWSSGLSSLI